MSTAEAFKEEEEEIDGEEPDESESEDETDDDDDNDVTGDEDEEDEGGECEEDDGDWESSEEDEEEEEGEADEMLEVSDIEGESEDRFQIYWESSEEEEGGEADEMLEVSDIDGESEDRCPICLNRFRDQDVGTPESCDHIFCLECINEWSKNVNTCPVDRQVFRLILCRHGGDNNIFKRIPVEDRNEQANEEEEEDLTYCEVCEECNREDRLLLCDGCDKGYHLECLTPPLDEVPTNEWFCPECAQRQAEEEEEEVIPQARQLRRVARTQVMERVRSAIEELRVRRVRHLRRIVSSSEGEAEETAAVETAAVETAAVASTLTSSTSSRVQKTDEAEETAAVETAAEETAAVASTSTSSTSSTVQKKMWIMKKLLDEAEESSTIETTAVASTSSAATSSSAQKKATPKKRKTTRKYRKRKTKRKPGRKRKRRTTKKRTTKTTKTTTKRKTTTKGKGKKRKGRKGKKRARTVRQTTPVTTAKSRIAGALGLETPPVGRTIPTQRSRLDKTVESGPSLSLFGSKEELIHFDDDYGGESEVIKPSRCSRSALSSYKPIGRVPVIKPEKQQKKKIVIKTNTVAAASNPFDFLGSIMQDQSKLHMDSKNVQIRRDGSLIAKEKEKTIVSDRSASSKFFKSSFTVVSGGSGPSILDTLGAGSNAGTSQNSALDEEYDPAHPTDDLEDADDDTVSGKVNKSAVDDDKYDPAHPTDELDDVSEEEMETEHNQLGVKATTKEKYSRIGGNRNNLLENKGGTAKDSSQKIDNENNAFEYLNYSKKYTDSGVSFDKSSRQVKFSETEKSPFSKEISTLEKSKKPANDIKISPNVKITETGKKVSPSAIKPFEISKKILYQKKSLYGGEIDFSGDVSFTDAGFENFEVNIKAIESVFKGTVSKPDAKVKDQTQSKEDKIVDQSQSKQNDFKENDAINIQAKLTELEEKEKSKTKDSKTPYKSKSDTNKNKTDKRQDWEEVDEGDKEDERQYREQKHREKGEKKKKSADKEKYYEMEDRYREGRNPEADAEIDTRLVVQVSQNTDSRTVWEEDEKIRKKKAKEEREQKKEKRRDEERVSKKDKKRKRRRSRSRSYDRHDKSKSRERKRSRSRSKRRHRDRSRSRSVERSRKKKKKGRDRSRDKRNRSRSRSRSRERSENMFSRSRSPFRRNNRDRESLSPVSPVHQPNQSAVEMQQKQYEVFKIRRKDRDRESLSPVSPVHQPNQSAIEMQQKQYEVFKIKRPRLDGKLVSYDIDDSEDENMHERSVHEVNNHRLEVIVTQEFSKHPSDDSSSRSNSLKQTAEYERVNADITENSVSSHNFKDVNYYERDDFSDEPEETEQFNYMDRDEFHIQNKHKQQHQNLIQVGVVGSSYDPANPTESLSPGQPPLPDDNGQPIMALPLSRIGEFTPAPPLFPPPPPPPTVLLGYRPPETAQFNGLRGPSLLGNPSHIMIQCPRPPLDLGPTPQGLLHQRPPNISVPININVVSPPEFDRGLSQTIPHQREITVNAFRPGMPEGPPLNLPPPHSHFAMGADLPPPPQHMLPLHPDGPPPSNLVHIPVEMEDPSVGVPLRPLLPPVSSTPNSEPQLVHLGPMSEPPPRLPIPLLPTSDPLPPQSVMVSLPPTSMSMPPPDMAITSQNMQNRNIPPLLPSQNMNAEDEDFIANRTPPSNQINSGRSESPIDNSVVKQTTVIPGLDMVEPVTNDNIDKSRDPQNTFAQLEKISKLFSSQFKSMMDTEKSKTESDGNKSTSSGKDGVVFKNPLHLGIKSSSRYEGVEPTDMAASMAGKCNTKSPVSLESDNLIDTDKWLEEVYEKEKGKSEREKTSEKRVIKEKYSRKETPHPEQNSDLADNWMEIIKCIPVKNVHPIKDKARDKVNKTGVNESKLKEAESKKDSPAMKGESKKQTPKENKHKTHQHRKNRHEKADEKNVKQKAQVDTKDSQELSSDVDMTGNEKYLRKLHLQERVVEEVKTVLKPHYAAKKIDKDQYKEIMRKAVPKICHSKSGDIDPKKIKSLIEAYVERAKTKAGR